MLRVSIPQFNFKLAKLEAIRAAPSPGNVSELKAYLGLLSYYSHFLSNLSKKVAPLYHLLQKSSQWRWTQTEQTAFDSEVKGATVFG
jgi:hypothetical protein